MNRFAFDASQSLKHQRTARLLRITVFVLIGLAFLALPKKAAADFTATVSGTTVTFTGNDVSGVLTLGEQGGMLTYGSYPKGSQANFKNLAAAQQSVQGPSLTQVTKIIVNGGCGDDTLIINNPEGSLIAPNAVIEFNGGGGNDALILQGAGGPDFHVTYTPGPTKDAGVIETTNGVACLMINFSGLEPAQSTGLVAVDDTRYEFAKSANQIINGLAGSDAINLNNQTTPAGITNIVIAGATVNFAGAIGPVTVTIGDNTPNSPNPNTVITGYGAPVTLIGVDTANLDATNQQVTATGTTQNDNIIYTPTGATAGTFYDNIGSGNNLVPNTVFNFVNASGNFRVFNDPGGNADRVTLRGTAARDLFEINQGSGVAQVLANNVTALLPVQLGISVEILDAEGVGGENTFQVIPAPGIGGQAQDNLLINLDGGASGANNALVVGSSFGASPGTLPVNLFAVVNKGPIADTGTVRVFTSAIANPDINYTNVQVVTPNVSGGSLNPNLLVMGPDLNEPNEQQGTATFLGSGSTIQVQHATIFPINSELPGTPADNDFYRVVAQTTGTLNFQVFFRTFNPALLPAGGNLNLQVLDAAGNVLGTGTTQVTIQVTAGQSYFLHVFGATAAVVNGYDVSIINTVSPLTVTGLAFNAVEGVPFSNQIVGTFNGAAIAASNFSATINWGDGSASSTGVVLASGPPGAFNVLGGHTYNEEGAYNVVVQVTDATTGITKQANSSATVADAALSIFSQSAGSSNTFSGTGGNNVSGGALNAFNAFKAAIGGVDNGGTAAPQNGGFRTINWDGVALDGTDFGGATKTIVLNSVVGIPVNRFQERGIEFEEVYAVGGPASNVDPSTFTTVNPTVANQFPAFSPTKTFAMFNDNTIDFNFVLPSNHATVPFQALSRGFGAIFIDVELPNTTSIEYFSGTTSLGKFFVPTGPSGQPEFFGVLFQNSVITNVHIELGNATLFTFDGTTFTSGPADNPGGGTDLAVTDDFVYAEPTAVSTGININATVGTPFTAKVASFFDADPNGQVSDYSAIVDWGDGTSSAVGAAEDAKDSSDPYLTPDVIITPNINGGFDVTGTHTYTAPGVLTITTSIRDKGGASVSAKSTATVTGGTQGTVQFELANYVVNEGSPRVDITVTRAGDTSLAASVGFATIDDAGLQPCSTVNGTASPRCDFEFSVGTLNWAAGDASSRTFSVAIIDDAYHEGNETFRVTLSSPVGITLGSPATATVTIVDNDPVTGPNPIDDTTFFVRQQYLDFLGREPDPAGLAAWVNLINTCPAGNMTCDRIHVSEAFVKSPEFLDRGYFIYRFYSVALGRKPNYAEFIPDFASVSGFLDVNQLEAAKVAFIANFMARPAFVSTYGALTNTQYVDTLLSTAGVTFSAAARQALIDGLNGGTLTRAQVLRQIVESPEVFTKFFNEAFVVMEYFGYLRRDPDALYLNWLAFLNANPTASRTMVSGFVGSIEYRQRFGLP